MQKALHETCQQYVERRLSEGWRIVWQKGYHLILSSPDGNILRPVDLRNDVLTIRPNAAGDITQFTPDDSAINWENVDEETPDEEATFNRAAAVGKYDLYGLANHTTESGTINFVKVYLRCNYTNVSAKVRIKIKTGGTEYDNGADITLTLDWTNYSHQWDTNPGGGAWTWAQIDALQAGIILTAAGTKSSGNITQLYVEVDYTPTPPAKLSGSVAAKMISAGAM